MSNAANTTATTVTTDELFSEYSDAFKMVNGFRPRGSLAALFLAKSHEAMADAIEALYAEHEAGETRAREELLAFRAKVEAVGLDPDDYMHLA